MHGSTIARGRFWLPFVTFTLVLALLASSGLLSTGVNAAGGTRSHSHIKYGGTVVLDDVGGSLWDCAFNPWNASDNFVTNGFTYEVLTYVNSLTGRQVPMLATSYRWGKGNKSLTFNIRKGVKWSDGKPFSAADVAFTFKLMKKFPGLDVNGLWTNLKSVSRKGNKVTLTFKHASVPNFFYIAGVTYIVPQHIWAHIKDPVKFTDPHPVATGPVVLKKCSGQDMIFTRNAHYWAKGKPYISTLRIPAFLDNGPGNNYLRQGLANWGCQYVPNVQAYYVSQDPAHRHYWYPTESDNDLYPNLTKWPFTIKAVRQAISLSVDRAKASRLGVYGYLPPSNQAGIVVPTFKSWYSHSLASKYNYNYNPGKAAKLLQKAGFKKKNGVFQKNGRKLSFTILGVAGFSDWVAELSIVEKSLQAAGIDAKVQNIGGDAELADVQNGKFDMAYYYSTGGPTPYYEMYNALDSAVTAKIGASASSNYERWRDKTTDRLLSQFSSTTSSSRQHAIMNSLQGIMLKDAPVIPLLQGVGWYQYDDSKIVGWPTKSNQFVNPTCDPPGMGLMLANLHAR